VRRFAKCGDLQSAVICKARGFAKRGDLQSTKFTKCGIYKARGFTKSRDLQSVGIYKCGALFNFHVKIMVILPQLLAEMNLYQDEKGVPLKKVFTLRRWVSKRDYV